jgi:hypothetical protein
MDLLQSQVRYSTTGSNEADSFLIKLREKLVDIQVHKRELLELIEFTALLHPSSAIEAFCRPPCF